MRKFKKSRLIAAALSATGLVSTGTLLASCSAENPPNDAAVVSSPNDAEITVQQELAQAKLDLDTAKAAKTEAEQAKTTAQQELAQAKLDLDTAKAAKTEAEQAKTTAQQELARVKQDEEEFAINYVIEQVKKSQQAKLTERNFRLATKEVIKHLKASINSDEDIHKTKRDELTTVVKKIIDEVSQQEQQKFNTAVKEVVKAKLDDGMSLKETINAAEMTAVNQAKEIRDKIVDKVSEKVVDGLINASLDALNAQLTEAKVNDEATKQALVNAAKEAAAKLKNPNLENLFTEIDKEVKAKLALNKVIAEIKNNEDLKLKLDHLKLSTQEVVKYLRAPGQESEQQDTHAPQRQLFYAAVKQIIDEVSQQEKQNFNTNVEDAAKTKLAEGLDAMKVAAQKNAINEAKKVRTKIVDKVFYKVVDGLVDASLQALEVQKLQQTSKQEIVNVAQDAAAKLKSSKLSTLGRQIDTEVRAKLLTLQLQDLNSKKAN